MAEEFQAGVCGSTLWNIPARSPLGFSPCSGSVSYTGGFGWLNHDFVEMKARSISTDESADSVSDGSMVFQDIQKPQQPDSSRSLFMDSTIPMMGIDLSSSSSTPITAAATTKTSDWNQTFLSGSCSGRSDQSNYHSSILQEDMNSSLNFRQERGMDGPQIEKKWSTMKNFCTGGGQDSTINEFKQTSLGFSLDDHPHLSSGSSTTATCQGFDMSSASFGYPSTLLDGLMFNTDHPQPQQSLFDNQSMNFPSTTNFHTNFNEFSHLAKLSPLPCPSLPKQQPISLLHSTTNANPLWNASTAASNDIRPSFFPSTQPQFVTSTLEGKPRSSNLTAKLNNELVQDSGSVAKRSCTTSEPAFKRPRIETPSPLPTFKVRKEKLGDRVTALQQLVSPFGKTDTASVLQEAIEYIKFLHDQVNVLSNPYMKNGVPIQHQQTFDKLKENEGPKQDLRSRGLCLVPISSTFPVASDTTADFWTPAFGGTFH